MFCFQHGDYPIHIACSRGLLGIVHLLCSLGCSLEVATAKGLYPLHLAAKHGHIAVVRWDWIVVSIYLKNSLIYFTVDFLK